MCQMCEFDPECPCECNIEDINFRTGICRDCGHVVGSPMDVMP